MASFFSSFGFSAENEPERNIFIPQKIRIEGLKKIEREAVLTQVSIRVGQMLTNKILHQDILSIYQMKFLKQSQLSETEIMSLHLELLKNQQSVQLTSLEMMKSLMMT